MSTDDLNTFQESGESAEHTQQMIEKGEQLEQANNPDRPEWLPDKFDSPEDMANAYSNLEQKMGQNNQQEEQDYEEEDTQVEEFEAEDADAGDVETALDNVGLDFDVLQQEYSELGGLSEDAYDALEDAGLPKGLVDAWIQGQEALATNFQQSVYDSVGGQDTYGEMIQWAANSMSPQEIAAYDRAVESGDADMVQLAVSGLQSRYQSAEGQAPSLFEGEATTSTGGTFSSWSEVTAAMKDTRYESDPAYRQQVTNKLARSNVQ